MPVHLRPPWHIPERELTDEGAWSQWRRTRRGLLAHGAALASVAALGPACASLEERPPGGKPQDGPLPLSEPRADLDRPGFPARRNPAYVASRPITVENVAARYNNFYEFSSDKSRVWKLVGDFEPRPWTIEIGGAVEKPLTIDVDDLLKLGYEERTYRFRCVEAWAMAVPWTGVPLRRLLERARPLSKARHVRFVSFDRPPQALGQRRERWWPWPYYESLSMPEATHDLTLLATGIYGHALPRQHGAPVRLVVPWKYGYKSIKSITRIELVEEPAPTFWNDLQPEEYGLEANVNPKVPHPRWSQAEEKMVGTAARYETRWLNGYAAQVGELYGEQPVVEGWDDVDVPWPT